MILGCTHYPLLEPVIKEYVKDIKLVDSASAVAKHADKILNDRKIKMDTKSSLDCFVTDLPRQFEKLGRIFLGESINEPQLLMTFSIDTVLKELYSLQRLGVKVGLEHTVQLLDEIGNPHKKLRLVHVAGTNGKAVRVQL